MSYVGTKEKPLLNALTSEDFWFGIVLFGILAGAGLGGGLLTLGIVGPGGAPAPVRIICVILGILIAGFMMIPVVESVKDIITSWKYDKRHNERIEERKAEQVIEEARRAARSQLEAKKATHAADVAQWVRQWNEALGIKPAEPTRIAIDRDGNLTQHYRSMGSPMTARQLEMMRLENDFKTMQERIFNQAANLNPWRTER